MLLFKSLRKLDSSSCSKDIHYQIGGMDSKKLKGKQPESMDPTAKKPNNQLLRPLTRQNVFFYYVPAIGTVSYTALSVTVLNPSLRFNLLPKRDLTNILLAAALFGSGCYLYSRPHIKELSNNCRYGFSAMGSTMFTFSSVLLWAILRSILPENVTLCSAAGVASSYILIKGATNYLEFVDSKISK